MAIPEAQLNTWTGQGAVEGSIKTHKFIRNALAAHTWPSGMKYSLYLQGSYANSTNIRGDSDVDVVVEATSVFYSNLSELEKQQLQLTAGSYNYTEFRTQVIAAVQSYCGKHLVDASEPNAIVVLPSSGRLKADVVPCVSYKRYSSLIAQAEGLAFWNQHNNQQVVNYPKLHIRNGELKNGNQQTNGRYKPSVRMFKNARRRVVDGSDALRKKFPSYFVECLFYNVPEGIFQQSYQFVFSEAVSYLTSALQSDQATKFLTQSRQHWLFGTTSVQWRQEDAIDFVLRLSQLWSTWQSQAYASVRY